MNFQHNPSIQETKFYKVLSRLCNSYELLVVVMKDLGHKEKRWDILRKLNQIKFNDTNEYYLEFEKYFDRILLMSENEVRRYLLENPYIKDDLKELDFSREDRKLKSIKNDLSVLGFTESQCKLICFRELTIEEKYESELAKRDKAIVGLKAKLKKTKIVYQGSLF